MLNKGIKAGFPKGHGFIQSELRILIELVVSWIVKVGHIKELVFVNGGHFLARFFGSLLWKVLFLKFRDEEIHFWRRNWFVLRRVLSACWRGGFNKFNLND